MEVVGNGAAAQRMVAGSEGADGDRGILFLKHVFNCKYKMLPYGRANIVDMT